MEIEYIGELLPDGHLSVDPEVLEKLQKGEQLKIKLEKLPQESQSHQHKEYDSATTRLLARIKNAKSIGAPDDPQELSHSKLMEDRMEEKFPWKG